MEVLPLIALGEEVREEGGGLAGPTLLDLPSVAQIGPIARHLRAVVGVAHRHRPDEVPAGLAEATEVGEHLLVVALDEHRRVGGGEGVGGRTGQGGDGDNARHARGTLIHHGLHPLADPGHRVGEDQTPLGVGVGHLDGLAVEGGEDAIGQVGHRAIAVLGDAEDEDGGLLEPLRVLQSVEAGAEDRGRPHHVEHHAGHVLALVLDPARVVGEALADEDVDLGGGAGERVDDEGGHEAHPLVPDSGADRVHESHAVVLLDGGVEHLPIEALDQSLDELVVVVRVEVVVLAGQGPEPALEVAEPPDLKTPLEPPREGAHFVRGDRRIVRDDDVDVLRTRVGRQVGLEVLGLEEREGDPDGRGDDVDAIPDDDADRGRLERAHGARELPVEVGRGLEGEVPDALVGVQAEPALQVDDHLAGRLLLAEDDGADHGSVEHVRGLVGELDGRRVEDLQGASEHPVGALLHGASRGHGVIPPSLVCSLPSLPLRHRRSKTTEGVQNKQKSSRSQAEASSRNEIIYLTARPPNSSIRSPTISSASA